MSEREIRTFIEKVLRTVVLGAGLILGAGACSDDNVPKPDGKVADASVDAKPVVDTAPRPEQLPLPYMAPDAAPLHSLIHRS